MFFGSIMLCCLFHIFAFTPVTFLRTGSKVVELFLQNCHIFLNLVNYISGHRNLWWAKQTMWWRCDHQPVNIYLHYILTCLP